jgi:hypothetical protein
MDLEITEKIIVLTGFIVIPINEEHKGDIFP